MQIFGPKMGPGGRPEARRAKMLSFWCPVMMVTKIFGWFPKKMDFGPKNCIFGPKFCIFLRYTYETPIFSAQTDLTQWDHKSPISWGNSGYLRFSGRCPFGCSASRCMAPIAKNAYYYIVSHGIVWYCMELNCILWYCIVSYGIALVLHGIARCCIVLYGIALYHINSYGIAWYCIVPLLASARGLYLARHLFTL